MDTIKAYLAEYRNLIESSFNRNENELAVNQQSLYNYQIHERERLRTEKRNSRLIYATGFLSLIVLFAAVIILSLKYRKHRMLLELNSTILELEELRKSLTDGKRLENGYVQSPVSPQPASDLDNLKNRLQEQIDSLTDELARKTPVSSAILSSDAYHTISGCIVENKTIPDNSPLWAELEQTILADSPLFRQRLQLLAGQDLKPHDYHLVLLIRCGVTPTQTTILLGRAKGTVSYRRRHVCEMLLGRKVDPHFIDDIIRCI